MIQLNPVTTNDGSVKRGLFSIYMNLLKKLKSSTFKEILRDFCPHTLILRLALIGHPEFWLIFTLPHEENVCSELIGPRAILFSFFVYLD